MTESSYRTIGIVVLSALAGALVLAAVVLLARTDDNAPIRILLPTPDGGGGQPRLSDNSGTTGPELKVDVQGAVRNPGVYTLRPGDRVKDALEAAGGATSDADLEAVNRSRRVQDEAYYYIPRIGETPRSPVETASATVPPAPGGGSGQNGGLIDLNTAPAELLETLPGIGGERAKAIVEYRDKNGPFQSVDEITKVTGIGSGILEKIRDLVTVGKTP